MQINQKPDATSVQIFNSPIFGEIRVSGTSEEPLFCLSDLCNAVGIQNSRNVKSRLDLGDVRQIDTLTNGGYQSMVYVNESGMYDVILRSDSPKAKPFKKWVIGDVLPTIRKTGSYSLQSKVPHTYSEALQLAADQAKQIEELHYQNLSLSKENEEVRPKAEFADCIMQSEDCISVGEMANILKQNGLFRKGQNAFYSWLRYNGYLLRRGTRYNLPSQKSMNNGIMKIAESTFVKKDNVCITRKTVITPAGQRFFINLLRNKSKKQVMPDLLFI